MGGLIYVPLVGATADSGRTYDVAADGRFLTIKDAAPDRAPSSIVVVQNWLEELKRLAPTNDGLWQRLRRLLSFGPLDSATPSKGGARSAQAQPLMARHR